MKNIFGDFFHYETNFIFGAQEKRSLSSDFTKVGGGPR